MASISSENLFASSLQDMKASMTVLQESLKSVDEELQGKSQSEQDFILAQKQAGFNAVVNTHLDILEPHVAALTPEQRLVEGSLFRQAVGPLQCKRLSYIAPIHVHAGTLVILK